MPAPDARPTTHPLLRRYDCDQILLPCLEALAGLHTSFPPKLSLHLDGPVPPAQVAELESKLLQQRSTLLEKQRQAGASKPELLSGA